MTTPRMFVLAALLLACDKSQPPATETPTPTSDGATGTPATEPLATAECKPTGCSGIVCGDEEVMTTCEYRPEYACYKNATCARQGDGACGWTKTPELDACLASPPPE
jgi:hypothetical protein